MSASDGTDRTPVEGADVCVIGAGPAGAMASYSLASRGHEVVVLEAGPRFDKESRVDRMKRQIHPDRGVDEIWDMGGERDAYTDTSELPIPLNKRRVKGVGGTSLHWGAVTPRFRPRDFELQSREGVGRDWPISYEDLRPYYAEAEQEIGVKGPDDAPFQPPREQDYPMEPFPRSYSDQLFAEAGEALDIEIQALPMAINDGTYERSECQGYGTCEHVCPSGAKYSADVHVRKAEQEGATVIDRAPVQRLNHGPDGEEVTEAVYTTPDGETHRQEADIFVSAVGAYETPRLLLLSESDQYPDGLANSSGLVGRYFMHHGGALIAGILPNEETHQGEFGPILSSGIYQFYEREEGGAINMMLANNGEPSPADRAIASDEIGDDLLDTVDTQYGNGISVLTSTEMLPHEDNYVTIDDSQTDDHGNPVPEVSVSAGEYAKESAGKSIDVATSLIEELGGTVVYAEGTTATDGDDLIEPIQGGYHPMGGARMGTDPDESVVDPTLRTHDLDNLYVTGGSPFVTGGAANPTLTIMALSLKAADHIDDRL